MADSPYHGRDYSRKKDGGCEGCSGKQQHCIRICFCCCSCKHCDTHVQTITFMLRSVEVQIVLSFIRDDEPLLILKFCDDISITPWSTLTQERTSTLSMAGGPCLTTLNVNQHGENAVLGVVGHTFIFQLVDEFRREVLVFAAQSSETLKHRHSYSCCRDLSRSTRSREPGQPYM